MLAGVSHDLRTPLTRLRLALAMLPRTEELHQDVAEMTADVEEMDRMIGAISPSPVARARSRRSRSSGGDARRYRRRGAPGRRPADLNVPAELTLKLRADAVKRA